MSDAAGKGIMLALLAAGQSRRFGHKDKLTALLHGKMIGLHAAETLATQPFEHHVIIASDPDHPCTADWKELGYEIVTNNHAIEGQSTSVRCAAQRAAACDASALLICLADMPYITQQHIQDLTLNFQDSGVKKIVASSDNSKAMPPAIFPSSKFEALSDLQGDQGARKLLQTAQLVTLNDDSLLDIDTPETLATENRKRR